MPPYIHMHFLTKWWITICITDYIRNTECSLLCYILLSIVVECIFGTNFIQTHTTHIYMTITLVHRFFSHSIFNLNLLFNFFSSFRIIVPIVPVVNTVMSRCGSNEKWSKSVLSFLSFLLRIWDGTYMYTETHTHRSSHTKSILNINLLVINMNYGLFYVYQNEKEEKNEWIWERK